MIVKLGDQPNQRLETIHFLLSEHKRLGALMTVPVFRGTLGYPVVSNPTTLDELSNNPLLVRKFAFLEGDLGAKLFFEYYKSSFSKVSVHDPGVIEDIDTLEDYRRASSWKGS
jgi:molybdenum cofactor cytidylyltransferase